MHLRPDGRTPGAPDPRPFVPKQHPVEVVPEAVSRYAPAVVELDTLQRQAVADGCRPVVGALILDQQSRVFVQRRGPDRAFLPNGWDLVGGHVEPGEALLEALSREVQEETGWTVVGEPQLAFVGDWRTDPDDPASTRREFDFLVEVDGDLAQPRLEWPMHTETRWIGADAVSLLDENAGRDDGLVRHLAELALRSAHRGELVDAHLTLFLDPAAAQSIEALRRRWDPASASQIAAHVTVAYPRETAALESLMDRVRSAGASAEPFELSVSGAAYEAGAHWWVRADVSDPANGWRRLRDLIVPSQRQVPGTEPHVTIVHPRNSNLGERAWPLVADTDVRASWLVREVAVTAFDGRRWQTVERVVLG